MATTNKSTKAKTKKPAVKAKKTTKSSTTKRAPAKTTKKSLSTKVSKPNTKKATTGLLSKLNILSAAVSLAGAIAAAVFMNDTSYQVVLGHLAKDELATKTTTVLVPAIQHLYDMQLRYLVVVALVLGAILPLLNLTIHKSRYAAAVKAKVNSWRWIDMAIVGAIMLEVVALLSGVQDIFTLKLMIGLLAITCALGWTAEKRNVQAGRPVWSEAIISLVSGSLPWLLIAGYAIFTFVYGSVNNAWYVYALYGAVLLGFAGYAMNLVYSVRRFRSWANYQIVERNYLVVGIVTKVAFVAILIAGFKK